MNTWAVGRTAVSCAAMVVLVAMAAGCATDESAPAQPDALPEGIDQVMYGVRTHITRDGIRRARVEADTAEFVTDDEIHMRPVTMHFFDEKGVATTRLEATLGIFHAVEQDMDIEGSVVMWNLLRDERLESERMRYVHEENRMYCQTAWTLYRDGGGSVMRGDTCSSDPAMDSLRANVPLGDIRSGEPGTAAPHLAAPGTAARDTAEVGAAAPDTVGPDTAAPDTTGTDAS